MLVRSVALLLYIEENNSGVRSCNLEISKSIVPGSLLHSLIDRCVSLNFSVCLRIKLYNLNLQGIQSHTCFRGCYSKHGVASNVLSARKQRSK